MASSREVRRCRGGEVEFRARGRTEEVFTAVDRLRRDIAVVIVDHNLDLVLALADRAVVLDRGHVVHRGPARPLSEDLELRRRVLWV